jgi:hypothetical protein
VWADLGLNYFISARISYPLFAKPRFGAVEKVWPCLSNGTSAKARVSWSARPSLVKNNDFVGQLADSGEPMPVSQW